jgi:metallophosphoesterase (TIGR00282 family)
MVYLPDPAPGLVVINVMGRVHMPTVDDPLRAARAAVEAARERTPLVFVDFHAEATGEKAACARYLDGLASAVIGTHTHVQTADERLLPLGTAFLTDAGMCGPYDSCIGMDVAGVIRKTLTGLPERYTVAPGVAQVNGAILDLDRSSGRAVAVHRINQLAVPETETA